MVDSSNIALNTVSLDDPAEIASGVRQVTPDLVNTLARQASNREQRRVEAEEDRVLIQAAQKGDSAAFRKLMERHQRSAFAIALGIVRNENDAREISQEAFFRVFRALPTFKGDSSFFTWLFRIVTNLSIDLMRRPGRGDLEYADQEKLGETSEIASRAFVAHFGDTDPLRALRRREIAERLSVALDALPQYHLDVILMREVEGMSYEEMADVAGVSKGTIMSRLFHARQKLQRALRDCYDEEIGTSVQQPNELG